LPGGEEMNGAAAKCFYPTASAVHAAYWWLGTALTIARLANCGTDSRSDDPMPKKTKGKVPSGTLSGVVATLFPFRDKVAPLDTPEYRKRAGEVIARAARSGKRLSSRKTVKSA